MTPSRPRSKLYLSRETVWALLFLPIGQPFTSEKK